jgi:hypothetical protein
MKLPNWIKNFFDKAFKLVSAIIKSVFTSAFKMLMARLSDIATDSITKLATTDLSSGEKREQAFKDIKAAALERALTFNDSDINLIIEIFHKNLKDAGVID